VEIRIFNGRGITGFQKEYIIGDAFLGNI